MLDLETNLCVELETIVPREWSRDRCGGRHNLTLYQLLESPCSDRCGGWHNLTLYQPLESPCRDRCGGRHNLTLYQTLESPCSDRCGGRHNLTLTNRWRVHVVIDVGVGTT